MSHDEHAQHVQLQYQPALPMRNGKVCVWLFLSTEIMFFAALIGVYIVIRFGAPAGTWPTPPDVYLVEPIGAFNTFVLICSSVSIVLSLEAAKVNKNKLAKIWLIVTFVLGTVFLLVKIFEYNSKFAHGIYPQQPRSLIHEKADLYYVAAVRSTLADKQLSLETKLATDGSLSEQEDDQLTTCKTLLTGLVGWTERTAATSNNVALANEAMQHLAQAIYPLHGHAGGHAEEGHDNGHHQALEAEAEQLRAQLEQLAAQTGAQPPAAPASGAAADASASSPAATPADAAATPSADATATVTAAAETGLSEADRIQARIDALALLQEAEHGLNHKFYDEVAFDPG